MIGNRNPGTVHLLSLFEYTHLEGLPREVSIRFYGVAHDLVRTLFDGPELSAALRKLVEAKDCAVRQAVIDQRSCSAPCERYKGCQLQAGHHGPCEPYTRCGTGGTNGYCDLDLSHDGECTRKGNPINGAA